MRIIFNSMECGLGSNGGTSTLVNSANTLIDLGHAVVFIDTMPNKHTWVPLKAEHIIIRNHAYFDVPDADVVIATGYKTVKSTVDLPDRCGVKTHWIRAWEHWQYSEGEIIAKVLEASTIKIVNSICLQEKLKKYGKPSYIIRPGYDFDKLFPMNVRHENDSIIVGALYRAGVHGQRKRTAWTLEALRRIKKDNPRVRLWMFGSEANPQDNVIDRYVRAPNAELKNQFYNLCNIWVAPTMSEGLHLPPAEAMITECPVVGTSAELSGIQDYLISGETGLMSDNTLDSFTKTIKKLVKDRTLQEKYGKAAREKILSIGDRQKNMNELVELLSKLKG